jgi:hypothetical protein
MPRIPRLLPAAIVAAIAGALPAAAAAQSSTAQPSVSTNWAGYAVSGSGGQTKHFSSVSGTWVAPTASCTPGSQTFSAFWVGIGGLGQNSQALEQTGSEADCTASGRPVYSAWYELVPAAPVTLKINVAAGDTVTASVTIRGRDVTIRFTNVTRGTSVAKTLRASVIDQTSAEWIAEAPSECDNQGNCVPMPLTNFGKMAFSNLSATSGGHTGTVSDSAWSSQAIELQEDTGGGHLSGRHRFARASGSSTTATPSALSATGSAFSVAFAQTGSTPNGTGTQYPGFGGGSPY